MEIVTEQRHGDCIIRSVYERDSYGSVGLAHRAQGGGVAVSDNQQRIDKIQRDLAYHDETNGDYADPSDDIRFMLKRIAQLEAERNTANKTAQDARNDNNAINRELDRLGAPKVQPSGFGYSPLGRLRRLSVTECGEGLKDALLQERNDARAENAKLREVLQRITKHDGDGQNG